jgi:thiol-disulfide isomerase/thioredoxin
MSIAYWRLTKGQAMKSMSKLGVLALIVSAGVAFAQPADDTKKDDSKTAPAPSVKPLGKPQEKAPPAKQDQNEVTLKVGDAAPAITVDSWVKGDAVTGFEKGRVYAVEFWATWCGPCVAAMPHITKLQKEYKKDVTIIAVAASEARGEEPKPEHLTNLQKFVKKNDAKMGYTVAYDSDSDMGRSWMRAAGRKTIPTAFIVDREGKISWIGGPRDMDEALQAAVAGAPAKTDPKKKDTPSDGAPKKDKKDKKEKKDKDGDDSSGG